MSVIAETECVYCAVRSESLIVMQVNASRYVTLRYKIK